MNLENKHTELQELTVKYLLGSITGKEKLVLENLRKSKPENNKIFEEIIKTWQLSGINKDIATIDVDSEWDKFKQTVSGTAKTKQLSFKRIYNIAAIFIALAISLSVWYYYSSHETEKKLLAYQGPDTVLLPDGSGISLNNNTVLKYSKHFESENTRQVFLESGEAYFEVTHNKLKPFVVNAGVLRIEVIGTSFNVNTATKDNKIIVTVNTGKVAIYEADKKNKKIILEAGDRGVFSKNSKKIEKTKNTDENYMAWKTKKFVFKNKKLKSIIKTLNQNYNTNIILDKNLEDCRYTSTFDKLSIDAILEILESTLDVTIKKNKDYIRIEGKAC